MQYKSSIRQKWQNATLVAQFDAFNDNDAQKTIFEVQFVNTDSEDYNDNDNAQQNTESTNGSQS